MRGCGALGSKVNAASCRGGRRSANKSEEKWGKGEERAMRSGGEMRPPKAVRDRDVPGKGQARPAEKTGSGKKRGERRKKAPRLGLRREVQGPRGQETARLWAAPGRLG